MAAVKSTRRGPGAPITEARAARLHRFVRLLSEAPRNRDDLLASMRIGLRTFYRELDALRRLGVKVRLGNHQYHLITGIKESEGHLPVPDPRLTLAELAELARGDGPAAIRLRTLHDRLLAISSTDDSAPTRRGRTLGRK